MIIYVVISAILLYLYYLKKDIAIFGAFVVVIFEIFRLKGSGNNYEGFGISGDGCKKYGFSKPNITSGKTLLTELKKIKTNVNKYIKSTGESTKAVGIIITLADKEKKRLIAEDSKNKLMIDSAQSFFNNSFRIYNKKTNYDDLNIWYKGITSGTNAGPKEVVQTLKDGQIMLKLLNKLGTNKKIKKGNAKTKEIFEIYKCLCLHWISIWKNIQERIGKTSGEDDEAEGDEGDEGDKGDKGDEGDEGEDE